MSHLVLKMRTSLLVKICRVKTVPSNLQRVSTDGFHFEYYVVVVYNSNSTKIAYSATTGSRHHAQCVCFMHFFFANRLVFLDMRLILAMKYCTKLYTKWSKSGPKSCPNVFHKIVYILQTFLPKVIQRASIKAELGLNNLYFISKLY